MGQPTRVLNVMLHPTPHSLMFWDMVSLMGYLVLDAADRARDAGRRASAGRPAALDQADHHPLDPLGGQHPHRHGVPLRRSSRRPFWMTAILAPRFLASAFAAGPALLILFLPRPRWYPLRRRPRTDPAACVIVTYAMLINVFFVLMELFTAFYSNIPEDAEHFNPLRRSRGQRAPRAVDVGLGGAFRRGARAARQPEDAPQRDHARRGVCRRLRRPLDRKGARPHHRRVRAFAARPGHGDTPSLPEIMISLGITRSASS